VNTANAARSIAARSVTGGRPFGRADDADDDADDADDVDELPTDTGIYRCARPAMAGTNGRAERPANAPAHSPAP
jgi:hypothetical protein